MWIVLLEAVLLLQGNIREALQHFHQQFLKYHSQLINAFGYTPCDKSLRPLRKTSNISILKLISHVIVYSVRSYWLRAFLRFPRLYRNAFDLLICLQLLQYQGIDRQSTKVLGAKIWVKKHLSV